MYYDKLRAEHLKMLRADRKAMGHLLDTDKFGGAAHMPAGQGALSEERPR